MKDNAIVKAVGKGATKAIFYTGKGLFNASAFLLGNLWKGVKVASKQIKMKALAKEIKELES